MPISREKETKTQNKNSFIIVSSVVATLLCGVLHASESDFDDKKGTLDVGSIIFDGLIPPRTTSKLKSPLQEADKINVGKIPGEKTFTLDKITNTDDQVSYVAGANKDSDTKGYTLKVVLDSVKGTVKPQPNKNIAHLIGGLSINKSATDNHINLTKIPDNPRSVNLYGGVSINSNANKNSVNVDNIKENFHPEIYGGYSLNGQANENKVTIKSLKTGFKLIVGGKSERGDANSNNTSVNDLEFASGELAGGFAYQADAKNNKVTGKNIIGKGGYNFIIIDGGVAGNNANSNEVYLTDIKNIDEIVGGSSIKGEANDNKVTVKNGSKIQAIYGATAEQNNANSNEVDITDAKDIESIIGGSSEGADANNNKVTVKNVNGINESIMGGYSAEGNAYKNMVDITSSNIAGEIYGGNSEDKNANKNKVSLKISSVASSVAGGSAKYEANNNILDITSSNIGGDVYGGYSNEGDAIHNTVNLFHNSGRDITLGKHFLVKGIIHGGLSDGNNKDAITDNTLNVTGKDLIAGNIKNFDEVNFNLPKDIKTNDVVLQLTEDKDTVLNSVKVNPYVEQGNEAIIKNLKPKEKIYIIKKASINENTLEEEQAINKNLKINNKELTKVTKSIISEVGASAVYNVKLNQDNSNLYLEIEPTPTPEPGKPIAPKTNPKLNHTLIPNLASSHVVNQMGDLMSDNIPNIAMLDNNVSANTDNIISFGYIKGYKSNIGKSDTDVNGAIVDAGIASRADNVLMGGFFEYSYADYDGSINSYENDGKINAYAIGALARFDLTNNFFIDSYAKIGKLNNNYTLKGYDNLKIDKDSTFYSLGAFLGHDSYFDSLKLTNRLGYAYSNVDGYDLDINGETLNIKDISSKRIKFDSIAYYQANTDTNVYARARLIYELDGKSSTYAPNINKTIESKNKGFSGGGEIGVAYDIKPLSNISFGVGAMGGKIDELSANLRFVYGW
ncbi:autotransporter outer membrane beta-barrel domain-containing protein [Campylobacter ureolyticus]|uniref:autotransporter outer membrane beta-barrel domain-containing protein n=1 Tax=Campylobacter ureolyticus TaxID=827 RepID=UPI0022B5B75E|nr:autotransporter outer membrane beta-barrel domain-containing protein [Campylobacter ureolyticus]MCZ6134913.1 autotransporter outer membrane beta-barrel domain-containing protein [Campylobacter ureolyticus]